MQERAQKRDNTMTPVVCELPLSADDLVRALLGLSPHRRVSILDSCGTHGSAARFLIAGFDPRELVEARGRQIHLSSLGQRSERVISGDVLAVLDERLAAYSVSCPAPAPLPAAGACIATFSYELVHQLERLNSERRISDEPDVVLAFYDTLVIHDYLQGRSSIISVAGERRLWETFEAINEALGGMAEDYGANTISPSAVNSNLTRDEYLAAVRRIKEHIALGDIYQANLTQQISCRLARETRPEGVFLRLRRDHPTSFAAFLRRRDDVVISDSPERFLRADARGGGGVERFVEAWPIKGTRPRGRTLEDDARLREELLSSEKDRAENVMIVDLLRNDLGRVCRYGSVVVTELCALEEHPTLFHLVSRVRGVLREHVTAGALLRATFPCGSITGAPKIRAMEIIAGTEPAPRGLSMGAIGYFSFDGSLDLNVAIRTMVVRDRVARFNVGGGIVADSCPALEYEESLVKARALLRALGGAL